MLCMLSDEIVLLCCGEGSMRMCVMLASTDNFLRAKLQDAAAKRGLRLVVHDAKEAMQINKQMRSFSIGDLDMTSEIWPIVSWQVLYSTCPLPSYMTVRVCAPAWAHPADCGVAQGRSSGTHTSVSVVMNGVVIGGRSRFRPERHVAFRNTTCRSGYIFFWRDASSEHNVVFGTFSEHVPGFGVRNVPDTWAA